MHDFRVKIAPAVFTSLALTLAPAVTYAATFKEVVNTVLSSFSKLAIFLIGLAVFLIVFGIFRYINAGDDPARRVEGGKLLMWGVIAVFVMLSFWGLVNIILGTFFSSGNIGGFNLSGQLFRQ